MEIECVFLIVRIWELNWCVEESVATSWNAYQNGGETTDTFNVGDYVACEIVKAGTGTHIVKPLFKTTLEEYSHI